MPHNVMFLSNQPHVSGTHFSITPYTESSACYVPGMEPQTKSLREQRFQPGVRNTYTQNRLYKETVNKKKIKQAKGGGDTEWRFTLENTVREGFPEKVTTEQRLESREPVTCLSRERAFQAEGQVGAVAQRSGLLGMLMEHRPGRGREQATDPEASPPPPSARSPALAQLRSTDINHMGQRVESMWPTGWAQKKVPILNCSHCHGPFILLAVAHLPALCLFCPTTLGEPIYCATGTIQKVSVNESSSARLGWPTPLGERGTC